MAKKENYTIQLEPEFVEKLDKLADKLGITRSQLMRNLVKAAYEDAAIYEKIRLIAATQFFQEITDYKEKLMSKLFSKKN